MRVENTMVRFTRNNIRFVVRENSIKAYDRSWGSETAMSKGRTATAVFSNVKDIAKAQTILTLKRIYTKMSS